MKKSIIVLLTLIITLCFSLPAVAAQVYVNGQKIDVSTTNKNGTTMIPLRFVSEALGASVNWDESTQSIYIKTIQSKSTSQPVLQAANEIKTKDKILNINEPFTKGDFSLTLTDTRKEGPNGTIFVCEFEYNNKSDQDITEYRSAMIEYGHTDKRFSKEDYGMLWYSDTDTTVRCFPAHSKGKVKFQFVYKVNGIDLKPKTISLDKIKWNID